MGEPKWYRVTVTWTADIVVEVPEDPTRMWPEIEIEKAAARYASSAYPDTEDTDITRLLVRPGTIDLWALPSGDMSETPPSVPPPPSAIWECAGSEWSTNGHGLWRVDHAPTSRWWRDAAEVAASGSALILGTGGAIPMARTITRAVDGVTEVVLRGDGLDMLVDAALLPSECTTLYGGHLPSGPAVWAYRGTQLVAIVMSRKGEVPRG